MKNLPDFLFLIFFSIPAQLYAQEEKTYFITIDK